MRWPSTTCAWRFGSQDCHELARPSRSAGPPPTGRDRRPQPAAPSVSSAGSCNHGVRCAGPRQVGFVPRSIACTVCSRCRTRHDRIVRIRLTKSGVSSSSRQKWKRSTMSSRRSVVATIVADRGSPSSRLISPKKSPACSSLPAPTGVRTPTAPSMMMKNESPGSPICVTTVPAGVSTILASSATRRSSSSLNPVKSGTLCRCRIRASWAGTVSSRGLALPSQDPGRVGDRSSDRTPCRVSRCPVSGPRVGQVVTQGELIFPHPSRDLREAAPSNSLFAGHWARARPGHGACSSPRTGRCRPAKREDRRWTRSGTCCEPNSSTPSTVFAIWAVESYSTTFQMRVERARGRATREI